MNHSDWRHKQKWEQCYLPWESRPHIHLSSYNRAMHLCPTGLPPMIRLGRFCCYLCFLFTSRLVATVVWWTEYNQDPIAAAEALPTTASNSLEDLLDWGDTALADGSPVQAIAFYEQGIAEMHNRHDVDKNNKNKEDEGVAVAQLETQLSLHTNLATAYSSLEEQQEDNFADSNRKAIDHYKTTIQEYQKFLVQDSTKSASSSSSTSRRQEQESAVLRMKKDNCRRIAAQASFFLGMVHQDLRQVKPALDAYRYAQYLDPHHWAALANLGSLLQDELNNQKDALEAYNQAFRILTSTTIEPTDPPPNPQYILSQSQYRIGICITHDPEQRSKCVVPQEDDGSNNDSSSTTGTQTVDCKEMATHAFALAVQYDPDNENAKHMLATLTADATMKRASNQYVRNLFDDYASNFEHSLVDELHYNGFERLRRGFDRAFAASPTLLGHGAEGATTTTAAAAAAGTPMFGRVLDAGCGTGLVGEQFRNISQFLMGVDLSPAILREAVKARPHVYNQTQAGDLIDVLHDQAGSIDLIVAADSYIYFGDLEPLFAAMETGLVLGGYIAFTLENVNHETETSLSSSKPDWRWQLTASGRFAHRFKYVIVTGERHNLELVHYETLDNFRYEQGKGVRGHLFVMVKKLDGTEETTSTAHNDVASSNMEEL